MFLSLKLSRRLRFKVTCAACAFLFFGICAFVFGNMHSSPLCSNDDIMPTTLYFRSLTAVADEETPLDDAPVVKKAYLTFDDGPSGVTPQILETLKRYNAKASFFVIAAENNEKYLPTLNQTVTDGHCIALHSCSHEYREIYQSPDSFWSDIEKLKLKLAPYVDAEKINVLRFPGGSTNTVSHKYGGDDIMKQLKQAATDKGYTYVDWNSCAEDATGGHPSVETIARNVISDCKGHDTTVILMHDTNNNKNTAEALPTIIEWLLENGYELDTVDHLEKQI